MSRLVYTELLDGKYMKNNNIESIISFFDLNNITYIYEGYISISFYDLDGDIDHKRILKSEIFSKNNIQTIFSTMIINNKKYSLEFSPISNKQLDITFGSYKKLDNNFVDFTWIYNNFLKKIQNELFCFQSIITYDYK